VIYKLVGDGRMIMSGEKVKILKAAVVVCVKV
jgi:hypothetical protein